MWEQRPAVRGPQGRALLRALRHRAVLARGRAGLRGRRGPVDLRDVPGHRARRPAARGRPAAGVDDDAVDACSPTPRSPSRPDLTYVRTEDGFVLAEARVAAVLGEDARVAERFRGRDILGTRYEPPFDFIKTEEFGPKGHTVLPGDFVSADDGTGIVHTSISFGEDDYRLGQEQGIAVINPVRLDGTYDERMGPYAGPLGQGGRPGHRRGPARARAAAARRDLPARLPALLALRHAAALLRQAVVVHRHVEAARPPARRQRDASTGTREHIKHGRFGRWLENNVDWAISRERYWGTPLPVWRCDERPRRVHRARFAELAEQLGRGARRSAPARTSTTPSWPCAECGEPMRRVPEVIDVWFDSGCMPFAQHHAPFENEDVFEQRFPADYICEAIDQTRGWFYSLIAVSTLLFDRAPYETVLCLGHIADPEGKKMSKSLGNIVVPVGGHRPPRRRRVPLVLPHLQAAVGRLPVLDRDGRRVGAPVPAPALEHVRLLRRCTRTSTTSPSAAGPATDLDRWALSRLQATVAEVARAPRRLRRDARRPGDRGVRRRPLELVRAPLAPALLGRRPGGVRDAAHLPRHGREAARAVHAVRRRRDLRQPRRRRAERAPVRLPGGRRSATRRSSSTWASRARRSASGCRARSAVQAQGAPAAARRRRGRRRPRARGARAPRRRRARGAQRQGDPLRRAGRRARLLRDQAELPRARPALRQG